MTFLTPATVFVSDRIAGLGDSPNPSRALMRLYQAEHQAYCGVDLHLDPQGRTLLHHDFFAALHEISFSLCVLLAARCVPLSTKRPPSPLARPCRACYSDRLPVSRPMDAAPVLSPPFGRAGLTAIGVVVDPGQSPETVPGTYDAEVSTVVKLRVRAGESIQDAVRRFRKLCERSGLRKEMRRKAYYEKPSERRRREQLKRLRKARQASRV